MTILLAFNNTSGSPPPPGPTTPAQGNGELYGQPTLESPVVNGFAITPSDSDDLNRYSRYVYVGTAGDLKVALVGQDADQTNVVVTLTGLAKGFYPLRIRRVYATGTTATNLVALY